ncbi:DUF1962-domain-containing protein [Nemania serpens]|nr:DUF1962-domain-containing protein [Nemania serpens]
MKITPLICTLMAAVAVSASATPELRARDTCGAGYGGDQRHRHFCGCDRTGVVQCKGGRWTEIQDCGRSTCHGTNDGAAVC